MSEMGLTRREFVKVSGAAGTGLVLSVSLVGCSRLGDQAIAGGSETFEPNAWIRIGTDGSILLQVDRSEMGQGVATSLPMLLAEELEAERDAIDFEFAPADPKYNNPIFDLQATGGSTSTRAAWEPLRKAGATARIMLVATAAERWGVPASECQAREGAVIHTASDRRATYGELVESAARQPVPSDVPLKDPKDFRLIGQPRPRLDAPPKVDGSAMFGIDVRQPEMRVAVVARPPVFGATLSGYDDSSARQVPGVREIVQIQSGVAVVADNYWAALQGRRALKVEWDEGEWANQSSEAIQARFREIGSQPGAVARDDGDAQTALGSAARRLRAEYDLPYLAHATMEPMNAVADVRTDGCEVWAPTQFQGGCADLAAQISGLDRARVQVHTTYLGGGFGRRFELDFVADALQTSKAVGAPVKVVYSREDDTRHDFYRPASYHVLQGGLDEAGRPTAWSHRMVVPSIMKRFFPGAIQNGVDGEAVEGAVQLPYAIPNVRIEYHDADVGVPVGFWRSVNHTHNAYVKECFLDELARAAGADPYEYRRGLLADAPRHRRVLELAAENAGWGRPVPAGRARGIALHESFGSFVAEVAEVSIQDGRPRVHRVVCAVDCGPTVNPLTIEAQIQSAVVYGLTAALYGKITIENGSARQGNFDTYRMLRIDEMPEVEVHIVPSRESIGGIGEVGTPPITPAVVNALYALTDQPIRRLPIQV